MRVVLLTGTGIEHRFVAAALAHAFGDGLVGIIVARTQIPRRRRLLAWWRRYTVPQILSRVAAKLYRELFGLDRTRIRTLERVLHGGRVPADLPPTDVLIIVPGHNSHECLELLRSLEPDVIVVYGTAIIRERVLAVAPGRIVNMHTGLSPWYRGSDTIFWPLHDREPDRIGVTVHLLSSGIDAGPILGTRRPGIQPDDDEDSLFAKCVIAGSELLIAAIEELVAGRASPEEQQPNVGREYRFVDRTVAAERRVASNLRGGLLARSREGST